MSDIVVKITTPPPPVPIWAGGYHLPEVLQSDEERPPAISGDCPEQIDRYYDYNIGQ